MGFSEKPGKKTRRPRKLRTVYLLPSLLTAGNMFFGLRSLQATMEGDFVMAAWFILFAAVLDGLDGKIARLANAHSLFGINFDSLADLTSFGIAPALLIYRLPDPLNSRITPFIIYAIFSAMRLARYNVQAIGKHKGDFTGLPTPAAGAIMATTYLFMHETVDETVFDQRYVYIGLQVLALLLGLLMVSKVRYPNLGALKIEGRKPFKYLITAVVIIAVAAQLQNWVLALAAAAYVYLFIGLIGAVMRSFRRPFGRSPENEETYEEKTD